MAYGPPPGCQAPTPAQCDGALYSPFVNSHLLDNYLTVPTLTMPGQPIDPRIAKELGLSGNQSPRTGQPLLATSRNALLRLKLQMLGPQMTNSQPTASAAPPLPSGANLGTMLGGMVNSFLRQ